MTEPELLQKLEAFVSAAEALDAAWSEYLQVGRNPDPNILTGDYPPSLPDFTEFCDELRQWRKVGREECGAEYQKRRVFQKNFAGLLRQIYQSRPGRLLSSVPRLAQGPSVHYILAWSGRPKDETPFCGADKEAPHVWGNRTYIVEHANCLECLRVAAETNHDLTADHWAKSACTEQTPCVFCKRLEEVKR